MSEILMCGHTGSDNRGCEAILRSTHHILTKTGAEEVNAMTFAPEQDRRAGLDKIMELIPYAKKPLWVKIVGKIIERLTGNGVWSQRFLHKNIDFKDTSCLFNVGGDTYCYHKPYISYALNELAEENGVKTAFWGCSVDERVLTDEAMKRDINRYSFIFARECLTYELMKKVITGKTRLYKICDPAFHLKKTVTELPPGFKSGNTVGINISPLVFKNAEDGKDIMYKNIHALISFILDNTDMNVCFIPHVYDLERNTQDIRVLSKIYSRYADNDRVSLVDRSLCCTELKYIISNCRFFIGARTHTTIAAYSTKVPCIAISYSIKSRGIARDLFGTEDGYIVKWQDINQESDICDLFAGMCEREDEIKKIYDEVLPEYMQSVISKMEEFWRELYA